MLIALVAMGVALGFTAWRLDAVRANLAAAEAKVRGFEHQQKYLARLRDLNDDWDVVIKEVGTSDQALSDYLSRAAGKLWP